MDSNRSPGESNLNHRLLLTRSLTASNESEIFCQPRRACVVVFGCSLHLPPSSPLLYSRPPAVFKAALARTGRSYAGTPRSVVLRSPSLICIVDGRCIRLSRPPAVHAEPAPTASASFRRTVEQVWVVSQPPRC
ncbi:hypothetical protein BV25DRAFT_1818919 [Artomyces pyxidatus]|uniref:Uncharacterized protein n=1 Tax=Artomyces pyxidatus TaxID=48021 RepID=A0ACB8TGJ9_9AGAM|nr:hypothetical protein BV25DRAFT_1818919 [Artomyces pyxidatus]